MGPRHLDLFIRSEWQRLSAINPCLVDVLDCAADVAVAVAAALFESDS